MGLIAVLNGIMRLCFSILESISTFFNNAAVGAFFGSFSAFIFGLIAYDYTKRREKWVTHHNALVKTEHHINRHFNDISGNIFLLKGSSITLAKGAFSENELSPLDNPDYMVDYHNIHLLNVYMDYQSLLEKANHDMLAWNKSTNRLFEVALSGKVDRISITKNRQELSRRTGEIISHLEDLMQSAYTTGAYIRKFMAVDKRDRLARLDLTANIKLTSEQVDKERKKLVQESERTMARDRTERLSKYEPDLN